MMLSTTIAMPRLRNRAAGSGQRFQESESAVMARTVKPTPGAINIAPIERPAISATQESFLTTFDVLFVESESEIVDAFGSISAALIL